MNNRAKPTELPRPYLLFLGEAADIAFAKTAHGLRDWAPDACVGEFASANSRVSIGLPALSPRQARAHGARSVVIGVANMGGALRDSWVSSLIECLEAGLDIISGLHGRLENVKALSDAAGRLGRRLIDVRVPPADIPIATGRKRSGRRLLTVGTDCASGKKYTALTLAREFKRRGIDADFRATGQTGILIAGSGIPIDAVIADFLAGAAEILSPDAPAGHWDVIEGQGSLFHPAYAGVSLGLLHGSQPDVLVVCHEHGRDRIMGLTGFRTPTLADAIEENLRLARTTNPRVRCAGIAINTSHLDPEHSDQLLAQYSHELGLPAADPVRAGDRLDALVDACLA